MGYRGTGKGRIQGDSGDVEGLGGMWDSRGRYKDCM